MARRHPQPDCLLKQVKRIQRPEKQEDFLSWSIASLSAMALLWLPKGSD